MIKENGPNFNLLKKVKGLKRLKNFDGIDFNNKNVRDNILRWFRPFIEDLIEDFLFRDNPMFLKMVTNHSKMI